METEPLIWHDWTQWRCDQNNTSLWMVVPSSGRVVWKQSIILSSVFQSSISLECAGTGSIVQIVDFCHPAAGCSQPSLFTRAISLSASKKNGHLCSELLIWGSKCVIMAALFSGSHFILILGCMLISSFSPQNLRQLTSCLKINLKAFPLNTFPYTHLLNK